MLTSPLSYLLFIKCESNLILFTCDILADDVTGMKAHSSHSCHTNSITQNGLPSPEMNLTGASNDFGLQTTLLQKSQEIENDNIPEEVSVMQTKPNTLSV